MDDHQKKVLSTDLPEDNLQLALRRASAADAKSLSEEGEQALAEQEEEMNNPLAFLHRSSAADAKSLSGEDQGLAAGLNKRRGLLRRYAPPPIGMRSTWSRGRCSGASRI